jgi:transcriptional regulator with GAF, ATPase, and Fis domain
VSSRSVVTSLDRRSGSSYSEERRLQGSASEYESTIFRQFVADSDRTSRNIVNRNLAHEISPLKEEETAMDPATLEHFLDGVVRPFDPVLTRLWLLKPGDQCRTCALRRECPDRRQCLHLILSLGVTQRIDGPFRRFPLGARQVGRAALVREPFVAHSPLTEFGLAEPTWLDTHRVASFGAFPLATGGTCAGVLALFARRRLTLDDEKALTATADLLASALTRAAPVHEPAQPEPRTLAEIERDAIGRVLVQTGGRVSGPRGAARILGLKPTTLHSRMKKLGVPRKALFTR